MTGRGEALGETTQRRCVEGGRGEPRREHVGRGQALHLERTATGAILHYAIADVPAFVEPGGALDAETRRRGQTLYAPDGRIPLHPPVLSEGAASLLPGVDRRAYVWRFELDEGARPVETTLTRAVVRSRAQWSYDDAQRAMDVHDVVAVHQGHRGRRRDARGAHRVPPQRRPDEHDRAHPHRRPDRVDRPEPPRRERAADVTGRHHDHQQRDRRRIGLGGGVATVLLEGDALDAWQQCTDDGTYVDYVRSVDEASFKAGFKGTPALSVDGTRLQWGGLVDEATGRMDTARLEEILTSGEVPSELEETP